jgi:hypothetical protein
MTRTVKRDVQKRIDQQTATNVLLNVLVKDVLEATRTNLGTEPI